MSPPDRVHCYPPTYAGTRLVESHQPQGLLDESANSPFVLTDRWAEYVGTLQAPLLDPPEPGRPAQAPYREPSVEAAS